MTLTETIARMFSKWASSPAQRAVNAGAPDAAKDPTDGQKRVGNYRKVHLNLDGFRISIENPKGSYRSGTSPDGTKWRNMLACDYGDIRGTESVDGDPVDIYLSDHPEKGAVFVIDQIDPKTGKFDEHKVMYGFDSIEDAKKTYLACYQKGWKGLGWITPVSKAEFRKWIDSSTRKTKPFHEYASVKPIVDTIKVKAAEAAAGEDNKECVKEAQAVKWAQFVPVNTARWAREEEEKDKISPDEDTRHFFDTIVPYIKSHSDTAGTPGVDYDASKFAPGFYRSVDMRKQPLSGTTGWSIPGKGVRIDPKYVGNSSVLVHELKHQQNNDSFTTAWPAWLNYIPFGKYIGDLTWAQSGRSAADDRLLSDTYHFGLDDLRPVYPGLSDYDLERKTKYEQGTTHAEHQFAIMRELKDKLGRLPTGKEFVDYVRNADSGTLNAWRAYAPNSYQRSADARNPRPSYGTYRRTAEEEAEKLDFPSWIYYGTKSYMDKYKQQPWYDPDVFSRSSDDGDPFDKNTEMGIRGGFSPKSRWIDGRARQMMEQNLKQALESFRRALMNVAKNKVRPGGLYQNAQNARRGMPA